MISIITTIYNNTKYIDEALQSFIESCGDIEFEILIGIDNCESSLIHLLSNYLNLDDRIKIFYFTNKVGTYVIRNTLANISQYENLIFFDSDDVMRSSTVPEVLKRLNEGYDFFRFGFIPFSGKLKHSKTERLNISFSHHFGAFGIKKNIFIGLNGFEPWICAADGEFFWRVSDNKYKIFNSEDVNILYRRHDNNLTGGSETGMKSKLRKEYHKIKELKISRGLNGPLEILNTSNYMELTQDNYHEFYDILKEITRSKLSIIIPTYNIPNYLNECLISVIQSCGNINCEVLVGIDKCESTLNYIKSKDFDPRIRFFYFENNVGPYVIKNSLSKISRSDNILFFDSDDIMKDTMVSDIIDTQNNFEFVKPMYSDFDVVVSNIKVNEVKTGQYGEGVFSIKKDLFLHMNGFEGWRCAADSDFMKRLYKNNRKFSYTDEVLFYRRKHSGNLTTSPETGFMSKLRAGYASITKNKKDFGPLPNIITENFTEIYPNNYTLIGDYGTSFINNTIDREKSEVISRLTLKRQTLKPIIQEVKESVPEKKEYISVDNTGVINTIFARKSNPETSQQPIQRQTNRQPVRNSQVQKDIINEKRKLLSQSQQKVTPDGFKQKKSYNKGNMVRKGGSFNF